MTRGKGSDCSAKEGNPFGPFWDTFGVDFPNSEYYGPLNYDVHHQNMGVKWSEKYPPKNWPGRYHLLIQLMKFHKEILSGTILFPGKSSASLYWCTCQFPSAG